MSRLVFLWLCALAATATRAQSTSTSSSSTLVEGGLTLHSGQSQSTNLAGASSLHATLGSMSSRGFLRLYFRTEGDVGSGLFTSNKSSIDGAAYQMLLVRGGAGIWISPFHRAGLQPMIGAGGIAGWQLLNNKAPPSGESTSSQGFHSGYEIHAGVQLNVGARGKAFLLRASYVSATTQYAGETVDLDGFQMSLGWIFGK
jgi:hypothetical protein